MKTLITEFTSLDGVIQAPGAPSEDTDGGWMAKYFDAEVIGRTFDALAKLSDALSQGRHTYLGLGYVLVPLIIGSGKKLFPAMAEPLPFQLISAVKASSGAQVYRYVRAR